MNKAKRILELTSGRPLDWSYKAHGSPSEPNPKAYEQEAYITYALAQKQGVAEEVFNLWKKSTKTEHPEDIKKDWMNGTLSLVISKKDYQSILKTKKG